MELYALQVFATVVTRAQLLARRREAVPHPAGRVAGGAAAGGRARREADRPRHARRQGAGADRRGPHRVRVRPPLPATSRQELAAALAELRDSSAGRLIDRRQRIVDAVPAAAHRALPRPVPEDQGADPAQPVEQDPGRAPRGRPRARRHQLRSRRRPRWSTKVIYTDALAFIVSPKHRLAQRRSVSIAELGKETFIAHNVLSPYRERRAARVPAPQGAAEHGRRDADAGDDPAAGAERRGRRLPAAHVRPPGRRERRRPRGARSRSCTSSARSGCSTRRRARSATPRKRSSTCRGRLTSADARRPGSSMEGRQCFGR